MKSLFARGLFCASLAAGCAAPPYLQARPTTAHDDGPAHQSGVFQGAGGITLWQQSWHPQGPTRGVVVCMHGLKDHSTRYAPFAARMVARGFAVYGFDMRGHGRSEGPRAALDSFDDLIADLGTYMDWVRAQEPGLPVFLLGHSVGGAIVTLYTLERRPALAGLVVVAPALRVDRMPVEAAATPVAAALTPNFGAVNTPNRLFSRDPAVVREMDEDPLVYQPTGPARTAASLVAALERIWSRADTLDVPVLGQHGTADELTDPRGTAELIRRARTSDHTLLLYRGLFHDLFYEPEREQVMSDVERWIDARMPAAPPAAPAPTPAAP